MEEASDLLEDSWFFGNLLNTTPRSISRCYSDLASSSCDPIQTYPHPHLSLNQEHVVKYELKNSSFSSRKQPPIAHNSLTRTPSLPKFLKNNPDPSPNLMPFVDTSNQEDGIINERKSSRHSSRKQQPVAPPSLKRTPSLPSSVETQSFLAKDPNPNHDLYRTSSKSSSSSDQEDEEDQESEFSLGRLIRQASMNTSRTSSSPKQTSKAMAENIQKKPEIDHEKISSIKKMERNRSKSTKNKNGGGAPLIPGGLADINLSEDMKAHIKFWARAVASNVRQVRQECS